MHTHATKKHVDQHLNAYGSVLNSWLVLQTDTGMPTLISYSAE